ncbi:MAG: alanine racemase [Pseudomonadota bacterium]
MATGTLTIDLTAIGANWRALNRLSAARVQTAATVKADGYGLGVEEVAKALARAGARRFFVAVAEEGAALRRALGLEPMIYVFGGHMDGDAPLIRDLRLVPMLNSIEQITRHVEALPGHPFGLQLDSGMNRLGLEPAEWSAVAPVVLEAEPVLLMSHLASADDPESPQSEAQLAAFRAMTDGIALPRSLAATGGTLLGEAYHFDMNRPGIGLFGGQPFGVAAPAVTLSLPVIQTRLVDAGESVGYNATWTAERETLVATVSGGYADGLIRAMSSTGTLWAGATPCPILGRVSMDLICCDVSALAELPAALDILGPHQGVDALAADAGTIGYEILTSLGARYARRYIGTGA